MAQTQRRHGRAKGAVALGHHGPKTQHRITAMKREHQAEDGPSYDPREIAQHDDRGRDRMFEGREQHDDADSNSEKTRLARDMERHHHQRVGHVTLDDVGPYAKRKS